ncbi:MAG TPA: hypothetical protein VKQ10_04895 [Spirochaetota bacterium]|nr:hypothetical protein [Spirochaetota bacterium]
MKRIFHNIVIMLLLCMGACGNSHDFYGMYGKTEGPCRHPYIHITKMEGFTGKYCLVSLKNQKKAHEKGNQFLGVIENNTITLYTGTRLHGGDLTVSGRIHVTGNRIAVSADGKECSYEKITPFPNS